MSDDDDYLSDKFLANTVQNVAAPKTYSQLRKESLKKSQEKNAQNRTKSRRQRELESREEGLNKSLIEKAREEEQAGLGSENKALSMMIKMGFMPGQSLGRRNDALTQEDLETGDAPLVVQGSMRSLSQHKTEPLPINEWLGKKGIGAVKRARSPSASERIAKMAKLEEEATHGSFRDRAKQEYEDRKVEARLVPAQRTCSTLDEKAGKTLNALWLNASKPETFPSGLLEALALHYGQVIPLAPTETIEERLHRQMQADALSSPTEIDQADEDGGEDGLETTTIATSDTEKKRLIKLDQDYDYDFLEEAGQFLRLRPQDRLDLVLSYLRTIYAYCFYCGTEYKSQEEMTTLCPGPEEDDHD